MHPGFRQRHPGKQVQRELLTYSADVITDVRALLADLQAGERYSRSWALVRIGIQWARLRWIFSGAPPSSPTRPLTSSLTQAPLSTDVITDACIGIMPNAGACIGANVIDDACTCISADGITDACTDLSTNAIANDASTSSLTQAPPTIRRFQRWRHRLRRLMVRGLCDRSDQCKPLRKFLAALPARGGQGSKLNYSFGRANFGGAGRALPWVSLVVTCISHVGGGSLGVDVIADACTFT